jgi:hypothetical protein
VDQTSVTVLASAEFKEVRSRSQKQKLVDWIKQVTRELTDLLSVDLLVTGRTKGTKETIF